MASTPLRPEAILLDFDHTLTDFGDHVRWPDARPALRALYLDAGVPEFFVDEHEGSISLYAAVAEHRPLPPATQFPTQRRAAAILDDLERGGAATTRALPGARELLDGLPTLGARAAVVTSNSATVVRSILRGLDLGAHIDVVIGRSEVVRLKPDPEGLVAACRLLAVAPARAVYVGDSTADIEAARAAGIAAWAVTTGHGTPEELASAGADDVFATLDDALARLREFEPATSHSRSS